MEGLGVVGWIRIGHVVEVGIIVLFLPGTGLGTEPLEGEVPGYTVGFCGLDNVGAGLWDED